MDYEPKDNEYLKDVKQSATYTEIKEWIMSEYGLKVSSLYVTQIKDKCGFDKRLNYNMGENKSHVPKCSPEKEKAIMAAFKYFNNTLQVFYKKISYRTFRCIISLQQQLQRKMILYDKLIIQQRKPDW